MKVSVRIITYQHEAFLAQALDSALMQRLDADVEIVVGEDASSDGTRDILLDYARRHPGRIRPLLHDRNLGMHENGCRTTAACRGEYVAFLDGDDYWTCDDKLQKQVDLLDGHAEYTACFHDALLVHEDGNQPSRRFCPLGLVGTLQLEDLLAENVVPTCGVMFRRQHVAELTGALRSLAMGDWPRLLLAARAGPIAYLDEVMGAYRVHAGGNWSRGGTWTAPELVRIRRAEVRFFETMRPLLGPAHAVAVREQIAWRSRWLAAELAARRRWGGAARYFGKSLRHR